MSVNTFCQFHMDGIARALTEAGRSAVVKRSAVFTKAVVIGEPDKAGSIMVSFNDEAPGHPGRSGWLVSLYPDHTPKEVADDKAPREGFTDDHVLLYWADMVNCVKANAK